MPPIACRLPTRFGPLLVIADPDAVGDRVAPVAGAVVSSGFREPTREESALLRPQEQDPLLGFVAAAVQGWDSRADPDALDRVPVALPESGFRGAVWRAMRGIPAGAAASYRDLAGSAGNPRAARAAGSACAANPVAPFVPCHRVVRSDGAVGQYGYGVPTKQAMLRHEGVLA